jgi:hypothetical protein
MAIVVASMVLVPLLAWMVSGIRIGERLEIASSATLDSNLLTAYLPRDVASSGTAAGGGADCPGGAGSGGTVLLRLTPAADPAGTIAYTAHDDGSGISSIWRRACSGGSITADDEILRDIRTPTGGWATAVTCAARVGVTADPCGRVTMRLTTSRGVLVEAVATRRVGGPR